MTNKNYDSPVDLENKSQEKNVLWMAVVPICILINLAGNFLGYFKPPIYLDAIGTLLAAVLLGISASIFAGVLSALLAGLLICPLAPYYTGTSVALSVVAGLMARKGFFRSIPKAVVTGIALGIVSAVISLPVTAILFRGTTGYGVDAITTLWISTGQSIVKSVLLSNFAVEPLDKTLQCLLVFWLIKNLPHNLKNRFANSGYIKQNLLCDNSF